MSKTTTIALTFALTGAVLFSACQASSGAPMTSTSTAVKTATIATTYNSPGGTEHVGFSIGVDDKGVITSAVTKVGSVDPKGIMLQTAFSQALPNVLIGKSLKDLGPIDRVAGASLTTASFNAALSQLKAQI